MLHPQPRLSTINVHVDPNKLRDLIETQEQSAVVLIILINAGPLLHEVQ